MLACLAPEQAYKQRYIYKQYRSYHSLKKLKPCFSGHHDIQNPHDGCNCRPQDFFRARHVFFGYFLVFGHNASFYFSVLVLLNALDCYQLPAVYRYYEPPAVCHVVVRVLTPVVYNPFYLVNRVHLLGLCLAEKMNYCR